MNSLSLLAIQPGVYVVAVSGGVDSMVLLDALRQQPNISLIVAHFNHGIREDSAADADLVAAYAQKHDLDFVGATARLGQNCSEQQARDARYKFLRSVRGQHAAEAIITAHHQDDAAETAVINILRGSGWRGLASLRGTSEFYRPLLHVSKEQLLLYSKQHNVPWREDSTNKQTHYLRNKIRLQVLPLARKRLLGFDETMQKSIFRQHELRSQIEPIVTELLAPYVEDTEVHFPRTWLIMLPKPVAQEMLRAAAVQVSGAAVERPTLLKMWYFAKTARCHKQLQATKQLRLRIERNSVIVYTL